MSSDDSIPKGSTIASRGERLRASTRALRHRNFKLFFAGQLVSLIGTWMQTIAQAWLIYRLTDSAMLLGLVGFANQIPVFLSAPIGGVIADRFSRRSILVATQIASMLLALILAALTFSGTVEPWHILLLAAILGVVSGFDIPARQSFVVEMVGREDLSNAIALNSSMFNGARLVGPAIAGLVVAALGEAWCFLLNGISYIAVIAGLLKMTIPARSALGYRGTPFADVLEGFRFSLTVRPVRALLLLLFVVSFAGMPYTILMPIFADRIFGAGATGLGILMSSAGLGALAASIVLAARPSVRGLGSWIAFSAAGVGISLVVFALSPFFWLSASLLAAVGFFVMLEMASSNTLIQSMVPDALRGRVMAVYSMMFMGGGPLGALLAGSIAERAGAPAALIFGGVACICGGVVFRWRLPLLREEGIRLMTTQQMAPGQPPDQVTGAGAP
ncbi:MAG TPA: MFS transporter [Thermoanaerobaculia bacterium]|nr:MFS transporter [Thermoanaerobaculia bacterium]